MPFTFKDAGGVTRTAEYPLAAGRSAAETSNPVALANEDFAAIGEINETAPASDAAPAGLNGRLQRLAQRITTLIDRIVQGSGPAATAQRVVLATDVGLPAGTNRIGIVTPEGGEYETVAASQTAQTLGATGATGDYLSGLLVTPATLSPGAIAILDNATSITVFAGGTGSVGSLVPFVVPLGIRSVSGAWKVTTGANVSVVAVGNFT